MNHLLKRSLLLVSVFALAASLLSPTPASAAGQALEINPPVLNLSANPGETIKTQIRLRNISPDALIVSGQVDDFVAEGEDGTPKILLDEGEESPYSLKGWVRTLSQLNLKSRELKSLTLTIDVPANAAPGGYYAVARFTGRPPELEGTGVSLSASLGTLILLTVKGDAKEGMTLESFSTTKDGKSTSLFQSAPITFVERVKNTGNIHEQPRGQVIIKDMFGKTIAGVNVNLPPRNVLPGSVRRFEQPLDKSVIGNKILFGRYTAELKMTYGAKNQTLTATKTFWVIPYTLIGIGIIGLIGIFILLRNMIKRYNRHIIKQASKRRK
jgi:hypothetical protein